MNTLGNGALSLLLLTAAVTAQSTIPLGYSSKEGETFDSWAPFQMAPCRAQYGYGGAVTGWTSPKVIHELWIRPDGVLGLKNDLKIPLQVRLSSKGCDPQTASNDWTKNHGVDEVVFIAKRTFDIPAFAPASAAPSPWRIQLKGDQAFTASGPDLVVDVATYAPLSGWTNGFVIDAAKLDPIYRGQRGTTTRYGAHCIGHSLANIDATGMNVDEELNVTGAFYFPLAGYWALTWLGSHKLSLPVPTFPGCSVYAPADVLHPQVRTVLAFAGLAGPFSWGRVPPALAGKSVYAQILCFDNALTTLHLSEGLEVKVGTYARVPTVSRRGNDRFATSGFDPDKHAAAYGAQDEALIFDVR